MPKLSDTQAYYLRMVVADWRDTPSGVSWPTLEALERRGLIETRLDRRPPLAYRQWRLKPQEQADA